jgi:hypothetical protein
MLGETTSRATLYVAMTRGRESNTAYVYERIAGEGEHEHAQPDGLHVTREDRDAVHVVPMLTGRHAGHDVRPGADHPPANSHR